MQFVSREGEEPVAMKVREIGPDGKAGPAVEVKKEHAPPSDNAAFIPRAALARHRGAIRRSLALALYGISLVGSLLWGGGGVENWLALSPNWIGVGAAVIVQSVATVVQWFFGGEDWYNPYYVGAVGFSAGTSILGYWPIAHPWLTAWLISVTGPDAAITPYAPYLAGAVIVGFLVGADVAPERTLIKED